MSHIFGTGRPTNFKLGKRMEYGITDMRGDLQLESSAWLFKSSLAGGEGAHCGGLNTCTIFF